MPAAAETYKWVDAKGVVNYSNAPPPEAAKTGQVVEDRVSVMGMDPAVRAWAERRFADRARADELDWQRRQQSLSAQQYYVQPTSSGYMDDYGYGYPYYYGAAYYPRFFRAAVFNRALNNRSSPPRVSHHSHGGGAGHGGGRGGR